MSEDRRREPDRLDRVESYQAIQQLAVRYALAVDSKDLEAIKAFYRDALSNFYRSAHLVFGHVIEFDDSDHAHGVVYCRADERGRMWWVWLANYDDAYERENGAWRFRRRRPLTIYSTDVISRPRGPGFVQGATPDDGSGRIGSAAPLPGGHPTFAEFWRQFPPDYVAAMTVDPVE